METGNMNVIVTVLKRHLKVYRMVVMCNINYDIKN